VPAHALRRGAFCARAGASAVRLLVTQLPHGALPKEKEGVLGRWEAHAAAIMSRARGGGQRRKANATRTLYTYQIGVEKKRSGDDEKKKATSRLRAGMKNGPALPQSGISAGGKKAWAGERVGMRYLAYCFARHNTVFAVHRRGHFLRGGMEQQQTSALRAAAAVCAHCTLQHRHHGACSCTASRARHVSGGGTRATSAPANYDTGVLRRTRRGAGVVARARTLTLLLAGARDAPYLLRWQPA